MDRPFRFADHPSRLDDFEFVDLSAPSEDINGQLAWALGFRPLRFKLYDRIQVEAAMAAGASSEAEAKQGLAPHYFEFYVTCGMPTLALLGPGETERATMVVRVDGAPQMEIWDNLSPGEEPDAAVAFSAR
jgi:hypothetical protein